MKPAALIAALVLAGQAGAESVYMPECGDADVGLYDVTWHADGFVFYGGGRYDDGETLLVLEDCPRQRRLTMRIVEKGDIDRPKGEKLFETVEKAVTSRQAYTMGQIEAMARQAGASTKLGAATHVSCACEKYGQPAN